jgi:hypothetical protein
MAFLADRTHDDQAVGRALIRAAGWRVGIHCEDGKRLPALLEADVDARELAAGACTTISSVLAWPMNLPGCRISIAGPSIRPAQNQRRQRQSTQEGSARRGI